MFRSSFRTSIAAALAGMALLGSRAAAAVLLPNGQPDPGYNGNAMQVWLRGDSGVTTKEGAVSDWQDRSNHGNDATQSTPSDQPVHVRGAFGGRQAVDFTPGDVEHLQFSTGFDSAFDGSFTMFVLLAPLDGHPSGDRVVCGLVSQDGNDRMILSIGKIDDGNVAALYKVDGASANAFFPYPWPDGAQSKFTLISYVNNAGGAHYVYVDGNPVPVASVSGSGVNNANFASGSSTAFIGSANDGSGGHFVNTYDGLIPEFIIYEGALSTADREAVEDYLLSYPPPILLNGEPDPAFDGNAMQVWLRANSGVTTAGGAVSLWEDRSSHGNDAVQGTPGDRPVQTSTSLPNSEGRGRVVNFIGGGVHLKFPTGFDAVFDGDFTMFALFAPDDGVPAVDRAVFGLISEDGEDRMVLGLDPNGGSLNHLFKINTDSANCNIAPLPFPDGPPSQFTLVSYVNTSGGMHYAYTNGGPVAAASVNGSGLNNANFDSGTAVAYLGSALDGTTGNHFPSAINTFDGGIVEFILYDIALSTAEREAVEDYLLNGPPPRGTIVILD